jgi:hypothetical protein
MEDGKYTKMKAFNCYSHGIHIYGSIAGDRFGEMKSKQKKCSHK